MPLVVFLRGLNVGGHRRFRPTALAEELRHLGARSVGAAGTFVIREPVTRARLREDLARRLPFEAEITICSGGDVARLVSRDFFAGLPLRADVVRFVSVLARSPRRAPRLPLRLPPDGEWLVEVLAREGRFLVGRHRRRMKVIGCLGELDRIFGERATTRSWSTLEAVARLLAGGAPDDRGR